MLEFHRCHCQPGDAEVVGDASCSEHIAQSEQSGRQWHSEVEAVLPWGCSVERNGPHNCAHERCVKDQRPIPKQLSAIKAVPCACNGRGDLLKPPMGLYAAIGSLRACRPNAAPRDNPMGSVAPCNCASILRKAAYYHQARMSTRHWCKACGPRRSTSITPCRESPLNPS